MCAYGNVVAGRDAVEDKGVSWVRLFYCEFRYVFSHGVDFHLLDYVLVLR